MYIYIVYNLHIEKYLGFVYLYNLHIIDKYLGFVLKFYFLH